MTLHILHFEWLRQVRSRTQIILLLIASVLLLGTIFTHWQHQTVLTEAQQHWQKTADTLWANQPDRHPHRVAHYGHVVVRPQAPLSFIEPGVTPYVGNYLFLEAHRQNSSSVQSSAISPVTLRMGYPSVASIMLVMWPLLLIVLGYGAFSNEWDSGRLFWLSSLGVTTWQLFIGKIGNLVFYTFAATLIIGSFSVGLLWKNHELKNEVFTDLVLLLVLLGAYSLVWAVIILTVSYFSKSSQQSLWRLLTVWLLISIVIPKAVTSIAEAVYPTPTRANFDAMVERAVHAVGDAHNPDDPYFSQFKANVLAQYNVNTIEELPINWNGLVMAEGERITSEIFQQHYNDVLAQFEAQDRFRLWFGFISPALAIQHISQKVANTDRASIQHFDAAAEAFRFDLIQRLNHLHSHEVKREADKATKLSSNVWRDMALFEYSPSEVNKPTGLSMMILIFWVLLTLFLLNLFWRGRITR
ncbi:ABC transporter permease [Teredinibacter turnerae]|uniref:ABC transporter permease n=1 Tax=Teredinibacter turnerae TaxID=2426 RepID=UPI000379C605|nr:DUF3526 domain-containing protein [Teredinibacter turnerae]